VFSANGAGGVGSKGKGTTTANGAPMTVTLDLPCPPSHGWSPPPLVNASSPVLPDAPPMGSYGGGSGISVGYSTSHGAAPNNNNGGGNMQQIMNGRVSTTRNSYSSLKGSGMSPSPSPGVGIFHHQPAPGVGSPTFGHANASVNDVGAGGSYTGYRTQNSVGVRMYSPTLASPATASTHSAGTAAYSNNSRTTATPPISHHPGTSSNDGAATGNEIYGHGNGTGLYSSVAVLPASGPPVAPFRSLSKMGPVDTINFELGALSANNDQSFMVFY
jgi:hypothetical protein